MTSRTALVKLDNYIGQLGGGEMMEEMDVIMEDIEIAEFLKDKVELLNYNDSKRYFMHFKNAYGDLVEITENEYQMLKLWIERKG